MKQVLQNLNTGTSEVVEAPCPPARANHLSIETSLTLVSAGTERMLVEFGKSGYVAKARQQPEKVKMVFEKIHTDGLLPTVEAVRAKLNQPIPLGYSNVGVLSSLGAGVFDFKVGDRIVSNGHHADMVTVAQNLCARIPDNVDDESAAFTVLASIGLQGIRLVQPTLGECVVVTGVGLIGLLTVQLLRAQGCRVMAIDFDEQKLNLARQFGAEICNPAKGEDPVAAGLLFSRGNGVDAVIITASTTSNDPVSQAARMSRKRGRIVLVGVTGLELNRADFYQKELSFQVSCSYGPGRYDPDYEDKGHDYPIGYVRWTEQRNFEAVLDLMASGKLDVKPLISHRFDFEDVGKAYDCLSSEKSVLGILLRYTSAPETRLISKVNLQPEAARSLVPKTDATHKAVLGVIGAGNYASRVLIPAFKECGAQLHTILTVGGVNGVIQGKKAGFAVASTDAEDIFSDTTINTVVVATRHDTHADFVLKALASAKHVFVEKPLCLSASELAAIEAAYASAGKLLVVGFNRRFAPQVQKIKQLLAGAPGPKSFVMTVNAGAIPADHWTQDIVTGGGRLLGEACHFVDLLRFLAASPIKCADLHTMASATADTFTINLQFMDGSIGTVHYFANGSKLFPKERLEIFAADRVLQLDNFRRLTGYGWPGFKKMNLWRQDKGQAALTAGFVTAVEQGGAAPIPADEIFEVMRVCLELVNVN